jgi:4-amino-4-deoxy-L-arabinose transferase-like glycosyltransferase
MSRTPSELVRSPAFIFAVALASRLALMIGLYTTAVPLARFWDTGLEMEHLAGSLAAGAGFASPFGGHTGPTAMLAPGYPLAIAGVFRLLGPFTAASAWTVLFLQCLFSALTCLVVLAIGGKFFSRTVGVLAAWMWAVVPPAMLAPAFRFWDTSLSTLLFAVAFLLLLDAGESPRRWLMWGVLTGIAALVNPALVPSLAALALWTCWRSANRRRTLASALVAAVIVAVMLAPWTVRNYRVFGRIIPVRSNLGMELWMGNHPGASGETQLRLHPATDPAEFAKYSRAGELAYFREKQDEAGAYIRDHPGQFLRLTAWRVWQSWTAGADYFGLAALGLPVVWAGLAGLALLAWRRQPQAAIFAIPVALYPLPFYVTHADARFRHPIEPLLFVLAGNLVLAAARGRRQRVSPAAATGGPRA